MSVTTPLAGVADVWALWRTLDPVVEDPVAARLLQFASSIVRNRIPSIDGRIANGTLDPMLVANVVASMVIRHMMAREGEARTEGDQRTTISQLAMTAAEVELLDLVQEGSAFRFGSIGLYPTLGYPPPFVLGPPDV